MLRRFYTELRDLFRRGDMVLLILCLVTSAFGCLIIASTTHWTDSLRFVIVQAAAVVLGIGVYTVVSCIDAEFIAEHRLALVIFNCIMLLLLIPFGEDHGTGNKSWLVIPGLPVDIQPAEFCKITFMLIMASVMGAHQNRISSISSVFHMVFHLGLIVVMNMALSRDFGTTLIFIMIFIGMAFAGGVKLIWFLIAGGSLAAAAPFIWEHVFNDRQRNRILVLFDPSIDPEGLDERWHTVRSLLSLNGGGLTGQGLFSGNRTQAGQLNAQHTDFIFSAIGEELGYLGCLLTLVLLLAIVARVIYVGTCSQDYTRRMICFGTASVLVFQIISNVGMCIGVTPVIGLTLPFISYGGSSILSLFAMMGLVSGVHARPAPQSHELYVQPHYQKIKMK